MNKILNWLQKGLLSIGILLLSYGVTAKLFAPDIITKSQIMTERMQIKQLNDIYTNLRLYTGAETVPLIVMHNSIVNAWTDGNQITFTTGILNFLKNNPDKIALVLGHEMAHVYLHHLTNLDPTLPTMDKESQADKMGAFFMMRAGYNICEGKKFFTDLQHLDSGDFENPDVGQHPSYAYRYYSINMPWCHQ